MKIVKNKLPIDLKVAEIEVFSDLHIGSNKSDMAEIIRRIERVENNPNVYCVILGDLINNSTKTSVGDCYTDTMPPMEQSKTIVELFTPIKNKVLGAITGNHELRSYKTDGIDIMQFAFAEMGILDKYDKTAVLSFVRLGKDKKSSPARERQVAYSIYMAHGIGQGGRTIGSKANGLERRGQIINADIIITGHTHAPLTFRTKSYEVNYPNSCITEKEQVFVNASATLDYEEYAEQIGMKPSSKISPVIILSGKGKKEIKVKM